MSLLRRILRFAATLTLALLVSLIAALALAPSWKMWIGVVLAAWIALGAVVWRQREWYYSRASRPFWLTLLGGLLALGVYLAWDDDTLRRPQTMAEVTPLPEGGAHSAALINRFALVGTPEFPDRTFFQKSYPQTDAEWIAFLRANAGAIRECWEKGTQFREVIAELHRSEHIGDDTASFETAQRLLPGVRSATFVHDFYARLLVVEGRSDEAFAVIAPLLSVGYKLPRHSRTLIRYMVAVVIQGMGQNTARFILEHGDPSPATRRAMVALLETGAAPKADVRRVLLSEFAGTQGRLLLDSSTGEFAPDLRPTIFRPVVRLAYNPRATANLVGEHFERIATAAENRDIDFLVNGMAEKLAANRRPRLKNPGGAVMLELCLPAVGKIVDNAWKKHDARLALITNMKARLGAAATSR